MGQSLTNRLMSRRAAILLVRNSIVSVFVFAFDLALLWVLVDRGGMGEVLAATLAFIAANSLHYVMARVWIFRGSERGLTSGYVYFLTNAGVGLVVTIGLFALLLQLTPLHYIVARIIVSVFAGLTVFLLNALFNFRSL